MLARDNTTPTLQLTLTAPIAGTGGTIQIDPTLFAQVLQMDSNFLQQLSTQGIVISTGEELVQGDSELA